MEDHIESFFEELGRRGYDPLLHRLDTTCRFEVRDGDRTERWLVKLQGGYIAVSKGDGEADFVLCADRPVLADIITGDTGSLTALVRGTLGIEIGDSSARYPRLTRLFAGPPETRG